MSQRSRDDDATALAHPSLEAAEGSAASRGIQGGFARSPAESGEVRRMRPIDLRRCLETTVALATELREDMEPERLGHTFVEALRGLLPERRLVLRLVEPDGSGRLAFAYATGELLESGRQDSRISAQALELVGADPQLAEVSGVRVTAAYEADFAPDALGFDVPILDGARLVGVLGVEYPPLGAPAVEDLPPVAQLAFTLGAALGRVRLRREATHLRGYLGKLLDHADVPILVIGKHREVRVASQGLLQLVHRRRDELVGRDFFSIVPDPERGRLLPLFVAALRGSPSREFEIRVGGGDRVTARLAISVSSILDAEGEVEGVMVVGRDVTAIRRLEDQVVQTEKLATLGQLAAGVVHELNNPLTAIAVYAEHLQRAAVAEAREPGELEKIGRILQAAERIRRFTRDLMVYARPSTEERTSLAIGAVLDTSVGFCEHVLARAGATLVRDEAPDLPTIRGVEGQLQQVFVNLVTNACHAVPTVGGRVTLTTRARVDGGVEVRVSDNGPGVPVEQRSAIFEPFFSTKRQGEGTGLGLSIVRGIVARHGGSIRVEGNADGGATFVVELPGAGT